LLLDADIELCPGMLAVAKAKLRSAHLDLLSVLAAPRMEGLWEKLSMPAFVYFFKLLYPFRLCNAPRSRFAAAAGGFVLLKTRLLDEIGGFTVIKDALIDDCALAKSIKRKGGSTWLGLSLSVRSLRRNERLTDLGRMVARTAFTQLNYSSARLGLCTLLMLVAFWIPAQSLLHSSPSGRVMALFVLAMMMLTYLPTLKFYNRSPLWALTLPLVAMLYLALTWASAIGYCRGRRSTWKGRVYRKGST